MLAEITATIRNQQMLQLSVKRTANMENKGVKTNG